MANVLGFNFTGDDKNTNKGRLYMPDNPPFYDKEKMEEMKNLLVSIFYEKDRLIKKLVIEVIARFWGEEKEEEIIKDVKLVDISKFSERNKYLFVYNTIVLGTITVETTQVNFDPFKEGIKQISDFGIDYDELYPY